MGTAKTRWFIHPKDSRTNEVVSAALDGLHNAEKFCTRECSDGVKRDMIEVPNFDFVNRMHRSRKNLSISFLAFRSQGNSLPAPWKFLAKGKTTLDVLKEKGVVHTADMPEAKKGKVVAKKQVTQF